MTFDATALKFSFFKQDSFPPTLEQQPYFTKHQVTVFGSADSVQASVSFELTVKNPCIDDAYNMVTLLTQELTTTYDLDKQTGLAKKTIKFNE